MGTEMGETVEKTEFCMMDQVPPIRTMVHTGSYHMLTAYCPNMRLWLFGDQHRASSKLHSEAACRLLEDTTYSIPQIRASLGGAREAKLPEPSLCYSTGYGTDGQW